ncbi:MAG TPA: hypothetical protein VFI33_16555 [Puia sp.]|nr:hypothetical protein [Puia sp.]
MKRSLFRAIGLFFLIAMTFTMAIFRTEAKANSPVPEHISGYNNHVNNQNNWGLFGIIGVIALAGLTKRNVVQKN